MAVALEKNRSFMWMYCIIADIVIVLVLNAITRFKATLSERRKSLCIEVQMRLD